MKAILFDLDGTVVNSEKGILHCVQYALNDAGIEETDYDRLRRFIGPPLMDSFRELYGFNEPQAERAVRKYRELYTETGIYECEVFDGVEDVLRELKAGGYVIALASSKPESFCRRILEYVSLTSYFDFIVGATMDGRISSKKEVLDELGKRLSDLKIGKSEMCLVGDTHFDVIGAREFGIRCIAVSYGSETREELQTAHPYCICDTVREVPDVIRRMS